MSANTDDLQAMLAHGADGFLKEHHSLQRAREFGQSGTGFDRPTWKNMGDAGWLAITLPESLGGSGLGVDAACELSVRFGAALLPEPFAQCAIAPASLLAACPPSSSRDELVQGLASGARLISLAWQGTPGEAEPGWKSARLQARGSGWLLDGCYVFTEASADTWLVAAHSGQEECVVAVAAGLPGITVAPQRMTDGTATGTLTMKEVQLPETAVLLRGPTTRLALQRALDDARLVTSAQLAGIAEGALSLAKSYIAQRVQFGQPVASFQAVRHRIVELDLQKRLASASWQTAVRSQGAQRSIEIGLAKARCGDAALLIARTCIQLHGAIGYTREANPGLFLDAAMRLASSLGNALLHRRRYVDALLAPPVARPPATATASAARDPDARPDFNGMSDESFVDWLRNWLETNCPPEKRRQPMLRLRGEEERVWLRKLLAAGLRAPAIAREHGGMGLSLGKQLLYKKVFDESGVARVLDMGTTLLAPVLIRYGSPEQKATLLPRIIACEDTWCQGYSEPGAGSDLARLRTSAVRDGDHFVINGQKIWTTHANTATHIFVLVRTNPQAKPQAGISFLLADLKTPGITIRPIVNLAGEDEFCEVFFDDVRVPAANLVGGLDQGWTVAKSLLGVERLWTGSPTLARQAFAYVERLLTTPDVRATALADERFVRAASDLHDIEALYAQVCAEAVAGRALDAEYSVIKILSSELFQRIADLAVEWGNERGGTWGPGAFSDETFDLYRLNMVARPSTIYSGTAEVQRDILARLLLGAPAAKA